jgi:hypothetical protein
LQEKSSLGASVKGARAGLFLSYPLAMIHLMSRGPKKYNDLQLACAVATHETLGAVLIDLGMAPAGGNYETVKRRIRELGLEASHIQALRKRQRVSACTDGQIAEAVKSSRSLAEVLVKLGFEPGGGRPAALKERIQELRLDTSHFMGQGRQKGSPGPVIAARPLAEILVEGRLVKSYWLRLRLIREGLKEARCEICDRSSWNGQPIALELDHINGRRDDNRLKNLRILCPNCHAQTDTYRGRNVGAAALS